MIRPRVIPALLIDDRDMVKTQRFRSPTYVGDPLNVVRIFNEKEADELVILDIGTKKAEPDFAYVERLAGECFMPLAYGGGIATVEHAKQLFSSGVEKLVVRAAAGRDLSFVTELANLGGRQSVCVAIDVSRDRLGRPRLVMPGTKLDGARDWKVHLANVQAAGAGEILLTSVSREGTLSGLDLELIREAAEILTIPLIGHGGASNLSDVKLGLEAGAQAVAGGAMFVFRGPRRAVLISYPSDQEIAELERS